MNQNLWQFFLEIQETGGFVILPLAVVSVLLWYGLTYRYLLLKSSRFSARDLVTKASADGFVPRSPLEQVAFSGLCMFQKGGSREALRSLLNEQLIAARLQLGRYRTEVHALVAIAPLLGLLGTVDGMIETFDSLGDMALFSQSGGIAGGISKALITTQVGLVISIPGLLLGRMIDRREKRLLRDLYQVRDLICTSSRSLDQGKV